MGEELKDTTTEQGQATEAGTGTEKTYTQAEVDALLQAETDRRVTSALKKAEQKNADKVKEAEKLAKMTADEQYRYQLEQREKAIAEKEKALAMAENKSEASKILAEKGISLKLVDFVVDESADVMNERIKLLDREFKASVKAEVEKRLGGRAPDAGVNSAGATKEAFAKMSLSERQALYQTDREKYKELSGS